MSWGWSNYCNVPLLLSRSRKSSQSDGQHKAVTSTVFKVTPELEFSECPAAWISPELTYESTRIGGKQTDVHLFVPKGFMDTLYLNWSKLIIDEYLWEKQADL